ncbi:MAG: TrbC/VirB2 family protein [Candidatus Paceibacterota bacterium]
MNIKRFNNIFWGVLVSVLIPLSINAEVVTLKNPLGNTNTLPDLIQKILKDIVNPIGAVVIVFFIIYTGFLFVKAQGKPEEITKVKEILLYVIIGAAIILGANLIALAIKGTINAL